MLSTKELWNKFANKEWIEKIEVLTGFSGEVFQKKIKEFPKMNMGFIYCNHAYESVIHYFYAFLHNGSEYFYLLFDDYIPNDNGGVTRVIDEEIIPNFDVTPIKTNAKQQRKEANESEIELDMCLLESGSLKKPLLEIYPKSKSDQVIGKYLEWEKRWRFRQALNSKIPLLGRFRFRL